jgi:hypothetical protein
VTTVLRPAFAEGQILAATDLGATVDHPRARAARHDRYLHEWGIGEGLELVSAPVDDPGGDDPYAEVTLRPGMAVDGTGREIVVPEPVVLSETAFLDVVDAGRPAQDTDLYPVFLAGLDEERAPVSFTADRCGAGQPPTRVEEAYQIIFGKLGEQRRTHEPPAIGDGPGDGSDPWRILLGYVTWNGTHLSGVAERDAQGISANRAGVRAATVTAPAGTLSLRTRPDGDSGAVVRIDDQAGLVFGSVGAGGVLTRLLEVSPAGDLRVPGTIADAPRRGDVLVLSGVVQNGVQLPLPPGVLEKQVTDGSFELHVWLRPHPLATERPATQTWFETTLECRLDETRLVHCRIRAIQLKAAGGFEIEDSPAYAEFLLLAVASAGTAA